MAALLYNDGLRSGGRKPTLWIVFQGKIVRFEGAGIPSVVGIKDSAYRKNGKWSHTEYNLELAPGATGCELLAALHNQVWPENDRKVAHARFQTQFGVEIPFEEFDLILMRDFPKSHARMVDHEAISASLQEDSSQPNAKSGDS